MPYAPGITYQPIRADMSGWGQALMQIMGEKDRKAEQAKQEAKQFKTYVAMGEQIGLNKDELLTKDLPTVQGMVEGTITKNKLQQEGEKLKQLMAERTAQEDFAKALQQAGGRNVIDTLNQGQGPIRLPALNSDMVLQAMSQNPGSFNARNAPDLLRIMEAARPDPTKEMFANANLLNAQANLEDAHRRSQPKPTVSNELPPQPDFDPPEGYNWTFNGKSWQMTQPRGKSVGDAVAMKLEAGKAGEAKPQGKVNEVIRMTKDGRRAIFDADSKQFIRYAE